MFLLVFPHSSFLKIIPKEEQKERLLLGKFLTKQQVHTHRVCTHTQKIATHPHTQHSDSFPMTAWEFLCSGVTLKCITAREAVCRGVCVCVGRLGEERVCVPEVAHPLVTQPVSLCKLHRETQRVDEMNVLV